MSIFSCFLLMTRTMKFQLNVDRVDIHQLGYDRRVEESVLNRGYLCAMDGGRRIKCMDLSAT